MAAPVVPVSDALFTTKPVATDKVGNAYTDIQKTRKAIVERFVLEHEMADAEASSGNQGKHIVGSARAYVADTPTVTPEAPVYSGADGYAKGRLNVRPTAGTMDYHNGTDWAALQYVGKAGNETVAGVKTFSSLPKTEISTAFASAANEDILPKKTLSDYLTAQLAAMQDLLMPVGFIYVQFPSLAGMETTLPHPNFGTWTEVTSKYAGAFFRANLPGTSTTFDNLTGVTSKQAQQLLTHEHSHTHTTDPIPGVDSSSGSGVIRAHTYDVGASSPAKNILGVPVSTVGGAPTDVTTGAENRPANYPVRIWQRTA